MKGTIYKGNVMIRHITGILLCITLPQLTLAQVCDETTQDTRTITGRCNNLLHPDWGVAWDIDREAGGAAVADGIFSRFEPAEYLSIEGRVSMRDSVANPIVASADLLQIEQNAARY